MWLVKSSSQWPIAKPSSFQRQVHEIQLFLPVLCQVTIWEYSSLSLINGYLIASTYLPSVFFSRRLCCLNSFWKYEVIPKQRNSRYATTTWSDPCQAMPDHTFIFTTFVPVKSNVIKRFSLLRCLSKGNGIMIICWSPRRKGKQEKAKRLTRFGWGRKGGNGLEKEEKIHLSYSINTKENINDPNISNHLELCT